MKEYKYKINGNIYKVAIGDIEDNIAHVEVNGTPYKVEMEKAPKSCSETGSSSCINQPCSGSNYSSKACCNFYRKIGR